MLTDDLASFVLRLLIHGFFRLSGVKMIKTVMKTESFYPSLVVITCGSYSPR
ncbi:hypothetical protein WN48_08626 [Eufriesea mexicana]|nr:hypothetical protein WN48_08626 [Eufriesea mexicana]